ncbi:unnamed protein product [Rotaria socialis]|uniref:Uncharacterized protein n=2 Tax=Rotaria socialis TaxID=392032 RepID=A0A818JJP5_9BILA|nr:unnamed protein product [Rotaria socialis]CAF4699679.1 unnamed protein product [Rotaria socialis]
MKFYWVLFSTIFLLSIFTPTESLFSGTTFQDFVDSFVDASKFKFEGILSLNDSAISRIWSYFKSKYGRVYASFDEEKQRFRVFKDHLKYVLESNLEKLRTFELELNEFSDWTIAEFNLFKKGLLPSNDLQQRNFDDDDDNNSNDEDSVRRSLKKLYRHHYNLRRLKRNLIHRRHHKNYDDKRGFRDWLLDLLVPNSNNNNKNNAQTTSSFDWRSKNVVSSVKDQQKCGCCYAFATAAVLESLYAIKTKSNTVTELSMQQITDCSSNGNNGCNGGNFGPSIRYLLGQGSKTATLQSYPYAGTKQTCKTSGIDQINLGNIQFGAITEGDEKEMANALVTYGPLFIGLDADSELFMFYKTGILNINNCPKRRQDMDHAMVAVGYGYDTVLKIPYWIIKNSWAKKWGENGYVRLAKDKGNMCGISSMAYYGKLT